MNTSTIQMTIDWQPLKAGDVVFVPVTDHPNFPTVMRVGQTGLCRDRDTAERIARTWNSLAGEWRWYAKRFVLAAKDDLSEQDRLQMRLL